MNASSHPVRKPSNDEHIAPVSRSETTPLDVMDSVAAINSAAELDSLNQWTTTLELVRSASSLLEAALPSYSAHLFSHESAFHEYREVDREGLASIPEDAMFIGCLSMLDGAMDLHQFMSEYQIDDPITERLLTDVYGGVYIVPVVHCFELLAFILLCKKDRATPPLTPSNITYISDLVERLQVNLFAASVADKRQRELLTMTKYPALLKQHKTLGEVYDNLLNDIAQQLHFDHGVCYAYEEETNMLFPFDKYNIKDNVPQLRIGQGISGGVFEWLKSVFVPDRATHGAYSIIEDEPFITGSFISVPLVSLPMRYGVITLTRDNAGGGKLGAKPFGTEHLYMLQIAASFIAAEITSRSLISELEESNFSVVKSLTTALEAKDAYTEGHSERVTKYAVGIAERMGYSSERLHALRYGAMLHDIGKIGITDAVLNKTEKLTEDEFSIIKEHTEIGYRIVNDNPLFKDVKNFIRYHHETIDGNGYYHKKIGEYPEEAMIISCADIFDALTSDRPYRKALPFEDALADMRPQIGVHFTSNVFEALEAYIKN